MELRELGCTGVTVPVLGLGCMGLVGWYGQRDDAEAQATVERALDLGMRHLDTAAVYQDGANERFVGRCIRGRRDEVFLATKCGLERDADGRLRVDNRPETIRRSCEESLRRLGTDCIDLFYLHRRDTAVPLDDSIGALVDLVAAGKVRFIGLSEVAPGTLREAHALYPVAALQSELSLWTRDAAHAAMQACRELGVGFVAYSPLGRGFLTGALRSVEDLPADDTRRLFPRFSPDNLAANRILTERLTAVASRFNCTPAQLALAWVMAQGRSVLAIVGTKRRQYLEENLGALAVELSTADLEFIEAALPQELVAGERYPSSMEHTLNG